MRQAAAEAGFREVRTPVFEHTELFLRGVGDTTDIVQKEMYTFKDKGDRSITLKPEGTAGVARCLLENNLYADTLPCKMYYLNAPIFRYEAPQSGRLREHHQFGLECFGARDASADAELILLAYRLLSGLGVKNLSVNINSIGCPHCRAKYYEKLREFFAPHKEELCGTCQSRFEKNPMRILDCKSEICREIGKDAPLMIDYLCDECREHFETLKGYLDEMGIKYTVDPKIVRGLDYYTKTVFEFITTSIGAQGTVCGGGRYDGLIEEMGGNPTPALGFAMGLERIIMTMEKQGCEFDMPRGCDIYIGAMGAAAQKKAVSLVKALRDEGYHAECDVMGRGVKAQMKYANKIGSAFSMIIGDNELEAGSAKLKNMTTGEETEITLGDKFLDVFSDIHMADMFASEE